MPAADAKESDKKKKVVVEKGFDPKKLVSYVNNPKYSLTEQRRELDLLNKLEGMRNASSDAQVEAVIKSMEIAYRMQTEAPDVFDIRKESQSVLDMYGEGFVARGCLQAVRLVEKGALGRGLHLDQAAVPGHHHVGDIGGQNRGRRHKAAQRRCHDEAVTPARAGRIAERLGDALVVIVGI